MPAPRPAVARWVAPAAALPWVLWAALRATGTERGFPLVPAITFTPHAAAASALPLALGLLARSPAGVALSVGSGTALAVAALEHRDRPQPAPQEPAVDRLRLATVSLRRGVVPAASVLDLVRRQGVDLLAVQELTPRALNRLRSAGLERVLPHAHVRLAAPGRMASAAGALWSRRPITGRTAVPGSYEQPTARLETAVGPVEITSVHPRPPAFSAAQVRGWTADLARLPAASAGVLRVLAGDFNASPDHAAFRAVVGTGYLDAAAAVGRGRHWTWQPVGLRRPRLTLDHVLVDPRIRVARVEFVAVRGSDHRSVVADLEFTAPST